VFKIKVQTEYSQMADGQKQNHCPTPDSLTIPPDTARQQLSNNLYVRTKGQQEVNGQRGHSQLRPWNKSLKIPKTTPLPPRQADVWVYCLGNAGMVPGLEDAMNRMSKDVHVGYRW
jgi:hypothetical protein